MLQPIIRRLAMLLSLGSSLATAWAVEPVDFDRDVRPILSDKCFLCHGPAEETRQADLRLDRRHGAIEFGALTPGAPEQSELLARILSTDADYVMPPPATGKSVDATEQQTLRRWIEQGATYTEHWAFAAPVRPPLPGSL